MHWLNWYTAMALNRTAISGNNATTAPAFLPLTTRSLNTLRYIHANPPFDQLRAGSRRHSYQLLLPV